MPNAGWSSPAIARPSAMPELKDGYRVDSKNSYSSISRAITLLRVMAETNDKGVRLSRLAAKADLHVATAHRILNVLVSEGLAVYDTKTKLYGLGIELYTLGSAASRYQVRDKYCSVLSRIAELTEDSVYLLIPIGNEVLCIGAVEGKTPIRIMSYHIGMRTPMGLGSGSLSLLALLPDEEIESTLANNEKRFPNFTSQTRRDAWAAILEARVNGFAISRGYFIEGVTGVGVAIYEQGKVIASISVAAIESRMTEDRIFEVARLVQKEIGLAAELPANNDPREEVRG